MNKKKETVQNGYKPFFLAFLLTPSEVSFLGLNW